jgi:hypothetical protein
MPKHAVLFVDSRYYLAANEIASPELKIVSFVDPYSSLNDYCREHQLQRIGFESELITFAE